MKKIFLLLCISLLFLNPVFSQDEEPLKVHVNLFHGGQNSSDLETVISAKEASILKNVVITRKGELKKRTGNDLFASDESNTPFRGIGKFASQPDIEYLIVASPPEVGKSTTSESWSVLTGSHLPYTSLTAGYDVEFVQANQLFFALNGQEVITPYNGANTETFDASPPACDTGAWFKNYLFLSGNPTNPDWVYFSNNLKPKTFDGADIFKVNTGDGQDVVRMAPFKLNEMIIYKEGSVWVLDISGTTPLTDWELQPVLQNIGCIAPRSVVQVGNDQWFLSSSPIAVRSLIRTEFDKIKSEPVSQQIQDIFDGSGDTVINTDNISKAAAVFFDNKYILAINTGTEFNVNNTVVVYDTMVGAWYVIEGWTVADWAVFNDRLYYADSMDGRVLQAFTGDDDFASGSQVSPASPEMAITFQYETKRFDFDNPNIYKLIDSLEVVALATGDYDLDVYMEIDEGGYQSIGSVNLGGDNPFLPIDLPFDLGSDSVVREIIQLQEYEEFRNIRFKFVQSGESETVKLHSFTCFAYPRPWRRE